jgi:hypothetical protein
LPIFATVKTSYKAAHLATQSPTQPTTDKTTNNTAYKTAISPAFNSTQHGTFFAALINSDFISIGGANKNPNFATNYYSNGTAFVSSNTKTITSAHATTFAVTNEATFIKTIYAAQQAAIEEAVKKAIFTTN